MIPELALAVAYLVAASVILTGINRDHQWAIPSRLFLGLVMIAWAGFYIAIKLGVDFQVARSLSRWLHLPTALSVTLIGAARWYADRKGEP